MSMVCLIVLTAEMFGDFGFQSSFTHAVS